ncbi:hypothetical protein CLV58_113119 [Spirosoma oryzae]|uniref:Uncharacterized protein n=1 Tax=Spirosoma oryzae TaxID=1469603 RepID=A0A2T0SRG0_9BACT|nr:hypothetical protein [Spirosoma oryzae]PRY35988.1 hypothetical protein CLV58_113119 [Spirosoma oryzae]
MRKRYAVVDPETGMLVDRENLPVGQRARKAATGHAFTDSTKYGVGAAHIVLQQDRLMHKSGQNSKRAYSLRALRNLSLAIAEPLTLFESIPVNVK